MFPILASALSDLTGYCITHWCPEVFFFFLILLRIHFYCTKLLDLGSKIIPRVTNLKPGFGSYILLHFSPSKTLVLKYIDFWNLKPSCTSEQVLTKYP